MSQILMKSFEISAEAWKGKDLNNTFLDKKYFDRLNYFLEGCYPATLKDEICGLYKYFPGMKNNAYDEHEFSFWTLEKSVRFSENLSPSKDFFCFADFLLESIIYAISLRGSTLGVVQIINGNISSDVIADSLDRFFSAYLINPGSIGIVL